METMKACHGEIEPQAGFHSKFNIIRSLACGSKNQKIECLTLKIQTLKLVYENGQYFAGKNPFKFTD